MVKGTEKIFRFNLHKIVMEIKRCRRFIF